MKNINQAMEIKRVRESLRESQAKFGERFGVTQQAVGLWERGKPPRRGVVELIIMTEFYKGMWFFT